MYKYIDSLNAKYLKPVDRTELINKGASLPTHLELIEKYKDREVVNILVLSGGGVRGVVPLYTLNYIEQQTDKKIGELFDFVAGTSTGAITAAALIVPNKEGGYKYSVADILKLYQNIVKRMFSSPLYHQILTMFGLFGPRYLPEGKVSLLKEYFGNLTIADLKNNFIVPVYDIASNSLELIRNWTPPNAKRFDNYLLRDVIHGASNPPMLFSPRSFIVNGQEKIFIDPALLMNNPVMLALMNARFTLGNEKKIRLVMIGNGGMNAERYSHTSMAAFGLYGLIQYMWNSPNLNAKLASDLVTSYVNEAKSYDSNIEFIHINMQGDLSLHSTDTSSENMRALKSYGEKMFKYNRDEIDKLVKNLIHDFNKNPDKDSYIT